MDQVWTAKRDNIYYYVKSEFDLDQAMKMFIPGRDYVQLNTVQ